MKHWMLAGLTAAFIVSFNTVWAQDAAPAQASEPSAQAVVAPTDNAVAAPSEASAAAPKAPALTFKEILEAPKVPVGAGEVLPWQLDFQKPASPVMERLTKLHGYLVYLIAAISVFVLGLLAYVLFRFSEKRNPVPSKTTHNTLIEIIWTVVPIFILVAIAIPSLKLHYFMDKTEHPEMTLKVVGYQWYWHYEYPEAGIGFDSYMVDEKDLKPGQVRLLSVDNPLVIPVDTNIRVLTTGGDVIHAFAIPAVGVKKDAMPGRLNETWFKATKTGVFYGQCSELCGVKHGFMPIEMHVVTKEEYQKWLEEAKGKFSAALPAYQQFASIQ